jgi:hypothetical protein
MTDGEGTAIT